MFDPEEYYKPSQLVEMHPLLRRRGLFWVLELIREGHLKATITTLPPKQKRYLVQGKDILEFLQKLSTTQPS